MSAAIPRVCRCPGTSYRLSYPVRSPEFGVARCPWGSFRDVALGAYVQPQQMSNSSSISHFLLLALADTRQLQLLHFCLFLGISLAALLGTGLIISAVACGHHLHTPMFFFLLNLALSDLGSICTTVPKALHNSLWDTSTISYTGCAAQLFFFLIFVSAVFPPDHHIFRAVLRIPSEQGRHKAFSTCLPHLAMVSLFLSTAMFAHLKPPSMSSASLDLSVSVLYLVWLQP
ncbi:Olfactory receptor 14I1 [Lonchura striata]|uniref:Olfactory receptor 14I1 n=1 Tax=Lonchura striata TaxID=40157 RepID=A0A218UJA2_9PASE|nr:Olfactory receptor 14I1 [Lonchura striata domestica]